MSHVDHHEAGLMPVILTMWALMILVALALLLGLGWLASKALDRILGRSSL